MKTESLEPHEWDPGELDMMHDAKNLEAMASWEEKKNTKQLLQNGAAAIRWIAENYEIIHEIKQRKTKGQKRTPTTTSITYECQQPYCLSTTFHVQYDPECGPKLICTQCGDDIDLDDLFLNKTLPTQHSIEYEWQE